MSGLLLPLAIILFFLAVVAGILGFRGIARAGCLVTRVLFFLLLVGFIIVFVLFLTRRVF